MLTRNDGRAPEMGRPVTIETDFVRTADGSCLICTGNTKVGGVIAPVFQPLQPVQQNGGGLLTANISYDSTHIDDSS